MTAHLDRRPPRRSIRQLQPGRGDLRDVFSERPTASPALPADLTPHQDRWPSETRQVGQLDQIPVLDRHPTVTFGARRPRRPGLDRDPKTITSLGDIEHVHLTETDQQLAHDNRIRRQQGLQDLDGFNTSRFVESLFLSQNHHHGHTPLKREVPDNAAYGASHQNGHLSSSTSKGVLNRPNLAGIFPPRSPSRTQTQSTLLHGRDNIGHHRLTQSSETE